MEVEERDMKSLQKYLHSVGITAAETKELAVAIKADPPPTSRKSLGPRLTSWLGGVMLRIASEGTTLASRAGSDLITQALWKFFGI